MPNSALRAKRPRRSLEKRIAAGRRRFFGRNSRTGDNLLVAAGLKEMPSWLEHRLSQALLAMTAARRANRGGRHEIANMHLTDEIRRICAALKMAEVVE